MPEEEESDDDESNDANGDYFICEDCGDEESMIRYCPVAREFGERKVVVALCEDCYRIRCCDI